MSASLLRMLRGENFDVDPFSAYCLPTCVRSLVTVLQTPVREYVPFALLILFIFA